MKLSSAGLELIKRFEGCRLEAYRCAAGVWTIGYGHTVDVKQGHKITQHQADVILESDCEHYADGVCEVINGLALTQAQFDALVSLAFNIGLTALANSTLLKKLRKGDKQGAADAFRSWVLAKGKKLPGLVARREAERALFLGA